MIIENGAENYFNQCKNYVENYCNENGLLKTDKLKNVKIGYLSEQGYNYRKHNNNMSKNIFKKNLTKLFVFLRGVM